jgi:hypothetical protein
MGLPGPPKKRLNEESIDLRRPGNHNHSCGVGPVGFASPAFAGFAFFGTNLVRCCSDKKANLGKYQVRLKDNTKGIFGGLAILATCVAVDPLALRPRLSPGLPFSVVDYAVIIGPFCPAALNVYEIWPYSLIGLGVGGVLGQLMGFSLDLSIQINV